MRYHPYGKILQKWTVDDDEDKYLTTQHERDKATGFDFRGARYYESEKGRFLSLDPMAMKFPGVSPYNYVLGNPVMFIDSDGREVTDPPYGINPYGTSDPLTVIAQGFQQLAQETGRLIDNFGTKLKAFYSYGVEKVGGNGPIQGSVSNETKTTITVGTNFEKFSTPNQYNKPSTDIPFRLDVTTTNETKVTVSGKVTVDGADIHTKNVTSSNTQTGEVNNNTTVTVGKGQSGVFIRTGTGGTTGGVKAEQKVSAGGKFINLGGEISVGN